MLTLPYANLCVEGIFCDARCSSLSLMSQIRTAQISPSTHITNKPPITSYPFNPLPPITSSSFVTSIFSSILTTTSLPSLTSLPLLRYHTTSIVVSISTPPPPSSPPSISLPFHHYHTASVVVSISMPLLPQLIPLCSSISINISLSFIRLLSMRTEDGVTVCCRQLDSK
jgi:hypothetical protein